MPCYLVDKIIRETRIGKGITQEELSFGICSVSTLSKIENGTRTPYLRTLEALMQRLGEPAAHQFFLASAQGVKGKRVLREIHQSIRIKDANRLRTYMEQYNKLPRDGTGLECQEREMILSAFLLMEQRESPDVVFRRLKRALLLTRKEAGIRWLPKVLYTFAEILIIQMMADCKFRMGDMHASLQILRELLRYHGLADMENFDTGDIFPSVFFQVSEIYYEKKQFPSALFYCERAALECSLSGMFKCLPMLLRHKATVQEALGNWPESRRVRDSARILEEMLAEQISSAEK